MPLSIALFLFIAWYLTVGYLTTHYGPLGRQIKEAERRKHEYLKLHFLFDDKPLEELESKWRKVKFSFHALTILVFPYIAFLRLQEIIEKKEWKASPGKVEPIKPKGFCDGTVDLACLDCGHRERIAFQHTDVHKKIHFLQMQCGQCFLFQQRERSIHVPGWKMDYGNCDYCSAPLKYPKHVHCPACRSATVTYRLVEKTALRDRLDDFRGEKRKLAEEIINGLGTVLIFSEDPEKIKYNELQKRMKMLSNIRTIKKSVSRRRKNRER
jgi:transcription elongation factor Elf1